MIFTRLLIINMAILFGYMIILTALFKGGVLIISIFPIAIQVIYNVVFGILRLNTNKPLGLAYLLCAVLVLLIGFPACQQFAGMSGGILGGNI